MLALVAVARVASADLIVPPTIAQGGHAGDALVRAGLLDATLYGADPTGTKDSTKAIQAAITDGRDYLMTTYLPAGTYLVSDTLLGAEDGHGSSGGGYCYQSQSANGSAYSDEFVAAQAPTLVGPPSGGRAVLKLADGTAGFGDPTHPKAALHFLDQGPASDYVNDTVGAFDCMMYSVVRDVDFDLGANPGAIGVQFFSAQYSYMANVTVHASGAYAGIEGAPATSDWVNLAVDGGQYGILVDGGGTSSIAGITLSNQTVAGLVVQALGASTVVGFDIEEPNGAAAVRVAKYNGVPQIASLALFDGVIRQSSGSAPAIANVDGLDLVVQNVYVSTPGPLVQSGAKTLAGSGKTDAITEYAYTDTAVTDGNYAPDASYDEVDGVKGQDGVSRVALGSGDAPSDLVLRHLPPTLPWLTDPGVVDVTTVGADPTGAKDSTAAIQKAIDQSADHGDEVFLPRGNYLVSGTLSLHPATRLFGVPGPKSTLWASTWDPKATLTPFIRTANTSTGATFVGDVQILLPDNDAAGLGYAQSYLYALEWQAGRSSTLYQAVVQLMPDWGAEQTSTATRSAIHVSGDGGGRWYGRQQSAAFSNSRTSDPGFRFLLVDATTAPLSLYGPNFEHALGDSYVEISHAANVRMFETKTECRSTWANVHDSANVLVAGVGGDWSPRSTHAGMVSTNDTNVELTNLGWYGPEGDTQGTWIGSIAWTDGVSLYQEGTFDDSPFPHCGDGVCDGAETSASCSADCGASAPSADGGATQPGDAGAGGADTPGSASGCACSTAPTPSGGGSLSCVPLGLLGVVLRRRARSV
ncbi:MAG TPA: glycosyl hydrolase family 28-related protein [Polyangiaceae bacterium]